MQEFLWKSGCLKITENISLKPCERSELRLHFEYSPLHKYVFSSSLASVIDPDCLQVIYFVYVEHVCDLTRWSEQSEKTGMVNMNVKAAFCVKPESKISI